MKMEKEFVFGVATAAFQIEGAAREDGKGPSIWDVYTHEPGRTKCGDTGDITCDHYHRFREDVRLMAKLGVTAYRFSVSWPRVLPDGVGAVNEKGIAFYRELIIELKRYGIEPYLTLYHWDLPQALFERGGWLNPDSPAWFYEYAKVIGERLGDLVHHFITINEPTNVIEGMTPGGGNAPGLGYTLKDRLTALHHLLCAHGKAVKVLRETVKGAEIGVAPCSTVYCPEGEDEDLIEAARAKYFSTERGDLLGNVALYCDPIFLGDYPKAYYELYRNILSEVRPGDWDLISQPIDYCFHNIYAGILWTRDGRGGFGPSAGRCPQNMLGWNILPQALYWGPKFLYERYGKPVMITENGLPNADVICLDGKVHDPERADFLSRYIAELKRARREGVDVRGYFYWSLMDNLEWEIGFGPRFGLIHVDFDTLRRTPKDSFYEYQRLIRESRTERR